MADYLSVGTPEDEAVVHEEIASQCKLGIVEIGVLFGERTANLLKSSTVPVYGIDPIVYDSMATDLIGNVDIIHQNTKQFGNRFTLIKDYSYNVVNSFSHPFDYVFIDGDHQYAAVKLDFEQWLSKLSVGGYVSLHDSAANRGGPHWWPGPSKLADELIKDSRVKYIKTVFSLTVFRKMS